MKWLMLGSALLVCPCWLQAQQAPRPVAWLRPCRPAGDYRARRQLAACGVWGAGNGVDAQFQQPVKSDLPALLISGALDVATPPEGAERVARDLRNSRHVVFPNQSHDSPNLACEARLIGDFISAGDAGQAGCIVRRGYAPAAVRYYPSLKWHYHPIPQVPKQCFWR
jgi:pimeloyl-ACP methyl ester carboxylesterase